MSLRADDGLILEQSLKLTALGKYNLIASLAEGGMAKVYLGLMAGPAGFNKLLVIKVLNRHEEGQNADENVQLFWDEARLAARMIHPNIVHTYEVGEIEGRYFLAMEYLDGQSYRALQNRCKADSLRPCEELRIIAETARGLYYAHELKDFKGEPLGVVHRDVSPQNVFITYDGQVKLLDFGIAKSQDADHKTQVGVIKGKLDYIAPEQLSGDNVDARTDIFALGIMLFEAVTGQRFAGGRKVQEVRKIHTRLTGGEPKVREVKPDVPEALAVIIDRAIALDPADRWADAGAFADALEAYIESTGTRPGAKSLSEAMNTLFAEERRTMHKTIDQQIELNKTRQLSATTGSLPHLGLNTSITPSGVRELDDDLAASSSHGIPIVVEPPKAAPSKWPLAGGAIGVAAAVLVGLLWMTQRSESDPRASAAAPPRQEPAVVVAPASDVSAAQPAVRPEIADVQIATVRIQVKTSPIDARVTLDGAEVPSPFSGEFRRDTALHHLEASAKGYQAYKKLIDFGQDQTIEIVLQPVERRRGGGPREEERPVEATAPSVREPVTAAPPPPTPSRPLPGADLEYVKPRIKPNEIDTANPYSKK